MGHVLEADCSAGDAYVTETFGTAIAAPWKVQFDLFIPSSTFTALAADEFTASLVLVENATSQYDWTFITADDTSGGSHVFSSGNTNWWTFGTTGNPAASFTPDAWLRSVVITYDGSDNIAWTYAGTTLFSYNEVANASQSFASLKTLVIGGQGANGVSGEVYYFDNVQVFNASNTLVFSDDFESGSLSGWSSTTGSCSIVADPAPSPLTVHLAGHEAV